MMKTVSQSVLPVAQPVPPRLPSAALNQFEMFPPFDRKRCTPFRVPPNDGAAPQVVAFPGSTGHATPKFSSRPCPLLPTHPPQFPQL